MGILSFLWMLFFSTTVSALADSNKKPDISLYIIPFRPILMGFGTALFFTFIGVAPAVIIAGISFNWNEVMPIIGLITILGTTAYWLPTGWFIRKLQGDKFTVRFI